MKVLDLQCASGHVFEGWFASHEDFAAQHARGLLSCPVCNDAQIIKRLSAPRLNLGTGAPPAAGSGTPAGQGAPGGAARRPGGAVRASDPLRGGEGSVRAREAMPGDPAPDDADHEPGPPCTGDPGASPFAAEGSGGARPDHGANAAADRRRALLAAADGNNRRICVPNKHRPNGILSGSSIQLTRRGSRDAFTATADGGTAAGSRVRRMNSGDQT